jgi:hypothetical protein
MGDLPGKMLVRAQRRTRNVVGLENALPKKQMAQRRILKEVGLTNALPKRWWLKGALEMR